METRKYTVPALDRVAPPKELTHAVKLDLPDALRWLANFLEKRIIGGVGVAHLTSMSREDFQVLQTALYADGRLREELGIAVFNEAQRRGLHMTVLP